ncbi:MAG: ATP-binding protein [Clostridia bacterium]|nr:ATP-binding protein [Clostridia bacterium]
MKHSVIYHPLIKAVCWLLCIASFLSFAYTGMHLFYMDMCGDFNNDRVYYPYNTIMPDSTDMRMLTDEFWMDLLITPDRMTSHHYGDGLSALIASILQKNLISGTDLLPVQAGGWIFPAGTIEEDEIELRAAASGDVTNLVFAIYCGEELIFTNAVDLLHDSKKFDYENPGLRAIRLGDFLITEDPEEAVRFQKQYYSYYSASMTSYINGAYNPAYDPDSSWWNGEDQYHTEEVDEFRGEDDENTVETGVSIYIEHGDPEPTEEETVAEGVDPVPEGIDIAIIPTPGEADAETEAVIEAVTTATADAEDIHPTSETPADGEDLSPLRSYRCTMCFGVRADLPVNDGYRDFFNACDRDHERILLYFGILAGSGVLFLVSLICTLILTGIRRKEDDVHLYRIDRIPYEFPLIVIGTALILLAMLIAVVLDEQPIWDVFGWLYGYITPTSELWILQLIRAGVIAALTAGVFLALVLFTTTVRRMKAKRFLDSTLTWKVLRFAFRIFLKIWRFFISLGKRISHGLSEFLHHLPLLWKWILGFAFLSFFAFCLILGRVNDAFPVLLWLLFCAAGFFYGAFQLIQLDRIRSATETMAQGKLDTHIDAGHMYGSPRRMAENLNNIGTAMSRAVEERLKSERFRTELITNVSHDIKTPLTSIINYTDLLSREKPENERMQEYIEVLSRQSARLKKLIEDLLEASKASSGALSVVLADTDAGELLSQAAGEYGERFEKAGLTPILRIPDEPIIIRADGRHLWRVFDNLMSNICKYSMTRTRVYLTAEVVGGQAALSFRNISGTELTVDASELTERFVRGDVSRHTEGSGLGLAIAKSLTELQGGALSISTDGDLFKVVVTFPIANQ